MGRGRLVIGVIIVAFLVLVALSAPMAIAIGLAVVLGLAVASPFPITIMFQKMIAGTDNFILVSIPLFVLTGNLMNAGGITDRIFTFVRRCVGFVPGGLAYANVGSSVIFAGCRVRRWLTRRLWARWKSRRCGITATPPISPPPSRPRRR
jgi:TRAP-type mannitol/chloroaromatic compound transport system permease large subunit